ncbi:MAG TPA: hypothetical protein PL064_01685, partial [Thermogutta sp.]|nr:hypothetical protein [Thermogutta sp.]
LPMAIHGNRTLRFIDANQNGQLDQGDTDITQYTWDHRNRLVKVEHRASYAAAVDRVIENAYDYANRWVRRRLDSDGDGHTDQRRIFVYDGNQIVLDFRRTGSGQVQAGDLEWRYLWGPAVDQILAEENVDNGADETVQWTLTDHLNTVRDIAKYDSGSDMTTVVNHLTYDAFGQITSQTNPTVTALFAFTGRLMLPPGYKTTSTAGTTRRSAAGSARTRSGMMQMTSTSIGARIIICCS